MANVILGGVTVQTLGELPKTGSKAPDFKLTSIDLATKSLVDYKGFNLVLNVFPSIDTRTCAQSVRQFNKEASMLEHTKVLCISSDLPFAFKRFCAVEGLDNVISLSDYKNGNFGKTYHLVFINGAFETLLSRCVIIINKEGDIVYTEQVANTSDEPNYIAALEALK
jgi:thiol peroxidase